MIQLNIVKRTDLHLLAEMSVHYSKPKGFVGRNICYEVVCNNICYGHIVAGSATRFLPGRDDFLGIKAIENLNNIVNNIFYHIEPSGGYPLRNFSSKVLLEFERKVKEDWKSKYNNIVIAIESLVELPRTGECYKRAGYTLIGQTKGFTCKRIAGCGTDNWSGKRVWDTKNLRPKLVFCKRIT